MQVTYAGKSDWYHALTVAICYLLAGIAGAVLAVTFFIGREITQAEYKWIERYGDGRRANMPWWGVLDIRVWDFHSWFWNLALPMITCAILIF